jgi:hypothetical protein
VIAAVAKYGAGFGTCAFSGSVGLCSASRHTIFKGKGERDGKEMEKEKNTDVVSTLLLKSI